MQLQPAAPVACISGSAPVEVAATGICITASFVQAAQTWRGMMVRYRALAVPPAMPTPRRDYVLWADAAGQWRCFEDRCPHRLATLSDGLVDKQRGEIVCAYHGWRFQVCMCGEWRDSGSPTGAA